MVDSVSGRQTDVKHGDEASVIFMVDLVLSVFETESWKMLN